MPFRYLVLLFICLPAFADEAVPVREDILRVRGLIHAHCDEWKSLRTAKVKCKDLRAKIDEVGTGERLRLEETVALADGELRSGVNRKSIPDITFSRSFWLQADRILTLKIGIVLHEYLGLLGVEGTVDLQQLEDESLTSRLGRIAQEYVSSKAGATKIILDHLQKERLIKI